MPRLRLDDGVIIALPDDATPAEIAEIVGAHYRLAKPQESPLSPEAIDLAEDRPHPIQRPPSVAGHAF